jgi:alkylation response protein AidB-like acyl-CoA dehydrogenase
MKKKFMWRASNTAELYFDDVRIPEENILGKKRGRISSDARHP